MKYFFAPLASFCLVGLFGCAGDPAHKGVAGQVVWASTPAPGWYQIGKASDANHYYFLGIGEGRTDADAKAKASQDAYHKLSQYVGVEIEAATKSIETGRSGEGGVISSASTLQSNIGAWSRAYAQEMKNEWHVRQIEMNGRTSFEARTLLSVPKWVVDEQLDSNEDSREHDKRVKKTVSDWEDQSLKQALDDAKRRHLITVKVSAKGNMDRGREAAVEDAKTQARNKAWIQLTERTHGVAVQKTDTPDPGRIAETRISTAGAVKGSIISETVQWELGYPVATVVLVGEEAATNSVK